MLWWLSRSTQRALNRARDALASLSCPGCGTKVGAAAARAAHEADLAKKHAALADAQARVARLRLDPAWRFACPSCAASLRFHPDAIALATDS